MTNTTCPPGQSYSSATSVGIDMVGSTRDDGMCTPCQVGTFKFEAAPSKCQFCAAGKKFVSTITECNVCDSGEYQATNNVASVSCQSCVAGRYLNDNGTDASYHNSVDDCSECSEGTFAKEPKSQFCLDCPFGRFSPAVAQKKCIACPIGKYQDQNKQTDASACKICGVGKYINSTGENVCKFCPAGKNLIEEGSADSHDEFTDCKNCPVLKFSPFEGHSESCYLCLTARTTGAASCDGCNPGTFKKSVNDTDVCTACPIGFYSDKQNLNVCYQCPLGYFANSKVSNDGKLRYDRCESCPRGTHGIQVQAVRLDGGCHNCTRGTFSELEAVINDNGCNGCPEGKWSASVGASKESACKDCGTGKYGPTDKGAKAESDCKVCVEGKYLGTVGAFGDESCRACPMGYSQNIEGQAFCLPCTPGNYASQKEMSECVDCSIGRASSEVARTDMCEVCTKGRYQPEPGAVRCEDCAAGRYGSGCQGCPAGYFRGASDKQVLECEKCPFGYSQLESGTTYCVSFS